MAFTALNRKKKVCKSCKVVLSPESPKSVAGFPVCGDCFNDYVEAKRTNPESAKEMLKKITERVIQGCC